MTQSPVMGYDRKPVSHFEGCRSDQGAALPANPDAAILEIGSARGGTGAADPERREMQRICICHVARPSLVSEMFEQAGFTVSELRPVTAFTNRPNTLNRLTGGRLRHHFMRQISIAGVKR